MTETTETIPADRELVLRRLIDTPPAAVSSSW